MPPIPLEFYVYRLIDPRCGSAFYVGKGRGERAWHHQRDAMRGVVVNKAKTDRILAILAERLDVVVDVVAEYDLEADAFEHEIELIASGCGLTNILAGGQGFALSLDEIARRQAARLARVKAQNEAKRKARKNRLFVSSRRRMAGVAGAYSDRYQGTKHSAAIQSWAQQVNPPSFQMRVGKKRTRMIVSIDDATGEVQFTEKCRAA